jgi:hypothetical protein
MPQAEFRHAEIDKPIGNFRIARTKPHCLLRTGLRLFETTEDNLGQSPSVEQGAEFGLIARPESAARSASFARPEPAR